MEAKVIAEKINYYRINYKLSDIAILYRANTQSRLLEEALVKKGIPYRIYGGLKFYDRKEIKDTIAYLRVIANPYDDVSLKRIINVPKRSIGLTSLDKIEIYANREGIPIFQALLKIDEIDVIKKARKSVENFLDLLNMLKSASENLSISDLIDKILLDTGYLEELKEEGDLEFQTRIENIQELKSVAMEFENTEENGSLSGFISSIALTGDVDEYEDEDETVTLMTLHSSKGLEFPIVFISGMEEGIFPSAKSLLNDDNIEEERRLCYVGMTRAKEKLLLSYALKRNYFGKMSSQIVSRFVKDISQELLTGNINKKTVSEEKEYSLIDKYKKKREMIAQIPKKVVVTNRFQLGEEVEHSTFGKGKIVAVSDSFYTIVFGKIGIKKVDINFAKLRKIEE